MWFWPVICLSVAFFYSIRLGFAQMNHSIEDCTAQSIFDLLVGLTTRLELAVDEMLIAIDVRFGQLTQAGRIHHQVHRAIGRLVRQHHSQAALATRQGRVVRRGQVQPHQTQHRFHATTPRGTISWKDWKEWKIREGVNQGQREEYLTANKYA